MPYSDPVKQREYTRLRMAAFYAARRARGLCTTCGTAALPERKMCKACLVRLYGYTRKRRERHIARGLCIHCEKLPSRAGKQMCPDCAVRHTNQTLRSYYKRKDAAKKRVNGLADLTPYPKNPRNITPL